VSGPITLNRQQFLATAAGQKPGSSYGNYLAYIAKARRGSPGGDVVNAAPADPYSSIIASLQKPMTSAQITTQANAQISPLVAAATKQIQGETAAATHAIGGFSADAASKLAAMNFAEPYQQAEGGQAAVDAALRASLANAGSADADQLSQRLAVINDPTVAQAASAVGANGAANGNTQLAQGSAALSNLLANAAAAGSYGQKLPGIAQLAGLQQIAGAQQQGQSNLATQTTQLESQLPSIIQGLESQNDTRAQNLTAARENQIARQDAINATAAKNATTVQTADIKAQTAKEAAAAKAAQTSFENQLKFAKTYGYDPVTGATLPGYSRDASGTVVKSTKPAAAKGQLTDNEAAKLAQQWHDGKPTSVTREVIDPKTGKAKVNQTTGKPVTETTTATTSSLKYGQAYAMLRTFGKTDQQARALLNTVYAKGDSGRAWVTNDEQAVLKKAGIPYQAKVVKDGHGDDRGLLGPHQYQTLKAAGLLPPGQLTQEGWYVIAPGH
jgi:hypothetical protein